MAVNYDDIDQVILRENLSISPAEMHGAIAAAVSQMKDDERAFDLVREALPDVNQASSSLRNVLRSITEQTRQDLEAPDLTFELALPDPDDEEIAVCALELQQWCSGFCKVMPEVPPHKKPAKAPLVNDDELLSDLRDISFAEYKPGEEPDENDVMTLTEHARVCVCTLYLSVLRPDAPTS